jgi:hypothetical protein
LIPVQRIDNAILEIRGQKVILSHDLAALYGVSTRRLNEQVKRNIDRFPPDFMFQLSWEETQNLRSESDSSDDGGPRSQFATLKRGRHHKYRPYAFTEHGAVMPATRKRRIGLSHPMAPAPSSQSGPDDNRTGSRSYFTARDGPPSKPARRRGRKP